MKFQYKSQVVVDLPFYTNAIRGITTGTVVDVRKQFSYDIRPGYDYYVEFDSSSRSKWFSESVLVSYDAYCAKLREKL